MAAPTGKESRKRRKTEVPGQALGYSLQQTRLVRLLLQAPSGSFCSLEVLDDVAQEGSQHVRLIQSKSALTANPVSNHAKSLWKTLANWVASAQAGRCDPAKTTFEIYVSRQVGGDIADAFSRASSDAEASAAITQAQCLMWGEAPTFPLRDQVSAEIRSFVSEVFAADRVTLTKIVKNFTLCCGSGSPQADLEEALKAHPISPSKVNDVADHLCGRVKREVDKLMEAGAPAIISKDEFQTWYSAYVRRVDRETVLLSRAKVPTEHESAHYLPRMFIRQLELIEMSYEDKLGAVSDYLMAAADRTDWAASGEVDRTAFEELNKVLERQWRNKKLACKVEHGSKPHCDQGQALYANCMQLRVPLQAMETPEHFIPGCLHGLADDLTIGWHPEYLRELRQRKAA